MGIVDTSNYTSKYDIEKIRFSGFLAQEVEQASKEIGYEFSGIDKMPFKGDYIYGLRYDAFVVPLVKAVQEQQSIIETLQKENAEKQSQINALKSEMNKKETDIQQLKTEIEKIKRLLDKTASR